MANLLLALIGFIIIKVCLKTGMIHAYLRPDGIVLGEGQFGSFQEPAFMLLVQVLMMNISLAIFNLLPVPPLDGSKVLYSILPASTHDSIDALERFSFIILIGLMYFGVISTIISPVRRLVLYLLLPGV
jgi:Zn-dependent protease